MISLANVKIGRKIAAVLGGIILLLMGLSALSLWGIHTYERQTAILAQRYTTARLAGQVNSDALAIAVNVQRMLLDKNASDELVNGVAEMKKDRLIALNEFRTLADTPASVKLGSEMSDLVDSVSAASKKTIELASAGKFSDAVKAFRQYIAISVELRAKSTEASQFQLSGAAETEQELKRTATTVWIALILGSLVALAGAVVGGAVLTRGIATPLIRTVKHLGEISGGDLSKDAPTEFLTREDEIGTLAKAKQAMILSMRTMVQEISSGVKVLSASSTELLASSSQMTSGSRSASDRAQSVSAAAEEMSTNITSVAVGMEQTTTNLAHVASAIEQMTSTIGEIAQNSENARRITDEATRQATRITEQINQLGEAAREIGKVTEAITEISSQTNLLALNATIEAARAGAAGKGFAVVATEIKALAQQTAAATEDIKGRVAGVQSATAGGIAEIGKVSQIILEVSAIVASIAAAIEEQSTATKDIARNIAEASVGVTDANTRVAETSQVSRVIAKDIGSVNRAAEEMASGSDHVRVSAGELSTMAEGLRSSIERFNSGNLAKAA